MDDFLREAKRIRNAAQVNESWKLNIEAMIESNNELFVGPIMYEDMEACYNFVLDQYDPEILISHGLLTPSDYTIYLASHVGENPFFSLIELDEQRAVKNVMLWETVDCELVAQFLEKKYRWKDDPKG